MKRIIKIKEVIPYKVVCEWSGNETRVIDFEESIKNWTKEDKNIFSMLMDKNIFLSVKLDKEAKTLYWENLMKIQDLDGKEIPAPLDFCPDMLYKISEPLKK